jgi:hypothetical protein
LHVLEINRLSQITILTDDEPPFTFSRLKIGRPFRGCDVVKSLLFTVHLFAYLVVYVLLSGGFYMLKLRATGSQNSRYIVPVTLHYVQPVLLEFF